MLVIYNYYLKKYINDCVYYNVYIRQHGYT